jgi:3-deoxy-D-manno-octulosonic-acid transferase
MNGADIIIMGKSFAGHDEGHNLIEPALLGKPIVTGLKLRNFRYIFSTLESHGALLASNDENLPENLRKLISSAELRHQLGERACQVISVNRGATDRTIDALEAILSVSEK